MNRTYNGTLRKSDEGRHVELVGFVQRARDLGGVIFIDLRDISGIIQLVPMMPLQTSVRIPAFVSRSETSQNFSADCSCRL